MNIYNLLLVSERIYLNCRKNGSNNQVVKQLLGFGLNESTRREVFLTHKAWRMYCREVSYISISEWVYIRYVCHTEMYENCMIRNKRREKQCDCWYVVEKRWKSNKILQNGSKRPIYRYYVVKWMLRLDATRINQQSSIIQKVD